ncbi:hypothetical protein CAPTEDRAFT_140350, partial [Capitella teleta]
DCGVENGGCQHRCTEDKKDEWCSCDEGFEISPNDSRECIGEAFHDDCHTCVNTKGGYTCECKNGYELDRSTKQKCIGELCGVG